MSLIHRSYGPYVHSEKKEHVAICWTCEPEDFARRYLYAQHKNLHFEISWINIGRDYRLRMRLEKFGERYSCEFLLPSHKAAVAKAQLIADAMEGE